MGLAARKTRVAQVETPPGKAILIYDGECGLCNRIVEGLQRLGGGHLAYLPYQDGHTSERFPEIPKAQFEKSVQLVEPSGKVYHGSEAVFRVLSFFMGKWVLVPYYYLPGFSILSELLYRFISYNRYLISKIIP